MENQHFSYQRERILSAVQQTTEHPSAEMIYAQLKPELPRLSLGTVYRNLHQLAQKGFLTELRGGTVVRFDAETRPHVHFYCTACGEVSDLNLAYDRLLDRAAEEDGRIVREHQVMFYGTCVSCAQAARQKQK